MNAESIIAELDRMPSAEVEKVVEHLRTRIEEKSALLNYRSTAYSVEPHYIDRATARRISDGIFVRNAELFRKLAQ